MGALMGLLLDAGTVRQPGPAADSGAGRARPGRGAGVGAARPTSGTGAARPTTGAGPAAPAAGAARPGRRPGGPAAGGASLGAGGVRPRAGQAPGRPVAKALAAGPLPVIDCLVTRHTGLPRDRMGNRMSRSGRSLIIDAVRVVHGLDITARDLARDADKRWSVPELGLSVSVAHCARYSAVALSGAGAVGVDLQDERDRPAAMRWLGELLGLDGPATIRDFTECEALIKASHITKETFAGVRLPVWRPGWRATDVRPYQVRSDRIAPDLHLAVVTGRPAPVRWWWRPGRAAPATPTDALNLEAA